MHMQSKEQKHNFEVIELIKLHEMCISYRAIRYSKV